MHLKLLLFLLVLLINFTVLGQKDLESGIMYLEQGKLEIAKQKFLQNKQYPKAKLFLGDIASHQKKWDLAISYYENLLESYPNSSIYNFKLGGALGMKAMEISKFKAAFLIPDVKSHIEKAVYLNPDYIEGHRALAELYLQLPSVLGGSFQKAKEHAEDLKALNVLDYNIALSLLYTYQEKRKMAVNAIKEGIQILKENPKLALRNYIYYEYAENAMNYEVCLDVIPKLMDHYIANFNYLDLKTPAEAYFRLSQLAYRHKLKKEAQIYIQKALEFDDSNPEILELKHAISNM